MGDRVDGVQLTADNVAEEILVQAYVRYQQNNEARRDFLGVVAKATFRSFVEALGRDPFALLRGLGAAAKGRHVQIYSTDPGGQKAIISLGLGGSATAPQTGDYLMPVGINAAGNKLDAFTRRTLDWRVQLAPDGSARARASLTPDEPEPAVAAVRWPGRPRPAAGQGREVADVDAVVGGELEQHVALGERLGDDHHDGQGNQQQGGRKAPPAWWLLWSRHVLDGTKPGLGRRQAVVNDHVRVLNWTHLPPLVAWT